MIRWLDETQHRVGALHPIPCQHEHAQPLPSLAAGRRCRQRWHDAGLHSVLLSHFLRQCGVSHPLAVGCNGSAPSFHKHAFVHAYTYTHVAAANTISFLPRRRPTWSHLSQDCIGAGLPFPTDQRVLPATTSSGAISNPSFQMQLSFLPPPLVVCLPSRLCPASRRRHYPCVFLLSTVPGWRRA